jgi:hypothetical protein
MMTLATKRTFNMRRTNSWNRLMESTEGPTVSVQIPREWAEELLRSLAAALEIEDMGAEDGESGIGDMDIDPMMGGLDDMEPEGPLDFDTDTDDGEDEELPAGDDDEEDSEDDDSDDDSDDDDDVEEEAVDFACSDRPTRPGTAFNESAFSKLAKKLGGQKGVKNPAALAASIGDKKYGKAGMAKKSAAGRKK